MLKILEKQKDVRYTHYIKFGGIFIEIDKFLVITFDKNNIQFTFTKTYKTPHVSYLRRELYDINGEKNKK